MALVRPLEARLLLAHALGSSLAHRRRVHTKANSFEPRGLPRLLSIQPRGICNAQRVVLGTILWAAAIPRAGASAGLPIRGNSLDRPTALSFRISSGTNRARRERAC